ncbi:MAG: response regulator [Myxococcota bacterium]|nr:response regulator [Myxococcota bacterium]
MGEAEERRGQKLLLRRLREMGIEARPLPGGRALMGELRLRGAPFPSPTGPHDVRRLRFATVGPHHLKCLLPRALFHLPLVSIGACTSADSIEDRIRAAWSRHMDTLRRTAERLDELGCHRSWEDEGAELAVPLEVGPGAMARMSSLRRIALPTPGPLAGTPLTHAADRLFEAPPDLDTAIDLELAVTARLEALAREASRRDAVRRLHVPEIVLAPAHALARRNGHRVLLVGPALAGPGDLAQALRVRGYHVERARSAGEALQAFARSSFDVVLTDAQLGREEGVDLVPALHALGGVKAVPVVVVDDRLRPARRIAAQQAGAAGYLAQPVDLERLAPGLARMAAGQRGRRFARYPLRLGVRFEGGDEGGVTLAVSRRGMFVRTERPSREGDPERLELALPGVSRTLPVLARTVYRVEAAGAQDPGLGLRIDLFPRTEDEAAWIALLCGAADDAAA